MGEIFASDGWLNVAITTIQDYIWTYVLIAVLLGCATLFTIRTKFVQFRMLGEMIRLLGGSSKKTDKQGKHISSFQAFAVSVASSVGTGNLAGVALAITMGGPGAVFWMWLIALLGSATAFIESTLAQLFKTRGEHSFIGGPAYYMKKGLHKPWMGSIFAVLLTLTFGFSYNSIQSNTICSAMEKAFGFDPILVGVVLTLISLSVVFGGIQRISKVSSVIVPVMAVGYLVLALFIIAMNITLIPGIIKDIVSQALGFEPFAGGTLGAVLMTGIKRGLFSNEAGEGSAPNAAATSDVSHPVKQGLIQSLAVFTDTIVICSCTAFIILISGMYKDGSSDGIVLTQSALENEVGSIGSIFIALAILSFAFSSIIGNYYYGETNVRYLTKSKTILTLYRLCSGGLVVMFGAAASLQLVWSFGDLFMALLTACNLIAVILLAKYPIQLLKDYQKQKKEGKDPVFHRDQLPEIANELDCWD